MHKSTINGEAPQFAPMPWWVSSGSQDEHVNSANINQFDWGEGDQKSDNLDKSHHNMEQVSEKEKQLVFQSAFSAGENKNSFKENNVHNHQTNSFQQFPPSQQKGYVELGLSQPMVDQVYTNYPLGDQCRGLFAAYGTPPVGRVMLPFSLTTEDGPIYVNPKQYHGILRRRKMRAKEGLKYKSSREKPYLHESRHRHACRRPRGVGGRFLNTKSLDNQNNNQEQKKTSDQQVLYHSSDSSASEVLQSDSFNLNSSKEVVSNNKSTNPSTSEVSSFYYSNEFDCFNINPARPFSFHPLANMESGRHGNNWAPATPDGCCDFFKL